MEQHSQQVQEAATLAVKKVFAILGVDVDKPESVESFREDLRFSRKLRRIADHGVMGIVGLLALGVGTAFWVGVVSFFKK